MPQISWKIDLDHVDDPGIRSVLLDEQISRLRTTGHLHANKLMEIDPAWRGYPERQ
jgi:hypothetical protein